MSQTSAEILEHTGPAEKEKMASVPQREQLTSTQESPLPKGTEPFSRVPDREEGESQGEREPHLGKQEEYQSEGMRRKE